MSSFAGRVLEDIDRRAPRAVIIDLRGNGGGDSSVLDPLLSGLRARPSLAQSGRLFAFIGNSTFSSALMNAISLKRQNGAILVGEPTGGKPNGYGEVRSFNLPNSGLPVSYSTKFFSSWPDGDPESLFPDIGAAVSSTDYREGRDPAMEAVANRLGLSKVPGAR
jgi:C-terminal processing protease CtpA/Prc